MLIRAGVFSDSHLSAPDDTLLRLSNHFFADCQVIIHSGDLTDLSVLELFHNRQIFAVHGNMCNARTRQALPRQRIFYLGKVQFGLIHGDNLGPDPDSVLWELFPEADCIISGHTHRARCRKIGSTLFFNPGTCRATGPYGAPGTCGILEIDGSNIQGHILEIPL